MIARTTASIPVEPRSPGQVFACMGFIEAADILLGGAEAHFDWNMPQTNFVLRADGGRNPFEVVLDFLAKATLIELTPLGYLEGGAADGDDGEDDATSFASEEDEESSGANSGEMEGRMTTAGFPSGEGNRNALPIQLLADGRRLTMSHWADGSSRDTFKLYSGNRSASRIAAQMLQGVRSKPKRWQPLGELSNRGLLQLWQEQRHALLQAPFDVITTMGGSFNFDARGAWTAIDAGYSPNTQKDGIAASPIVEILAAIGLEHVRPDQYEPRKVGYAVWGQPLPPMLSRAALTGAELYVPTRRFEFELNLSGKNKIITYATEETRS